METNTLCERESRAVLAEFYEELMVLIQDSDAVQEKERMKEALKNMTTNTSYLALGEEGAGKTSLLSAVFRDIVELPLDMAGDICEYRWGETEAETPLLEGYQKKFIPSENLRGLSIIDTKGINSLEKDKIGKIKTLVDSSDAVFVVLDARKIKSFRVWDIIENYPEKKMIFFITKCDMISEEELEENIGKVRSYMKEGHISAPLFPVSIEDCGDIRGTVPLEKARLYIQEHLIGRNPILKKQYENIEEMKKLLVQLKNSFALRKKQYLADVETLHKINASMDTYVANHKEILDGFLKKIVEDVSKDIEQYQEEIISKLDPHKIKENFQGKKDFIDYLNIRNENYKNMMNDSVNRKTIAAMKQCLHDLEIVYQEAVGYFEKRETILELNDKFYGSISKSKGQIVAETKETVAASGQFYKTLSDASETLFMQIWSERKKYDRRAAVRKAGSVVIGGAAGAGGGGAAIAAAVGTATGLGVLATGLGIVIGLVLGAAAINKLAEKVFDPKAEGKMEEAVQQCVKEFKQEVSRTREAMITQITEQIAALFERELFSMDGCFTEFRMSVNIDERRLPELEAKMSETMLLLDKINRLEV